MSDFLVSEAGNPIHETVTWLNQRLKLAMTGSQLCLILLSPLPRHFRKATSTQKLRACCIETRPEIITFEKDVILHTIAVIANI